MPEFPEPLAEGLSSEGVGGVVYGEMSSPLSSSYGCGLSDMQVGT